MSAVLPFSDLIASEELARFMEGSPSPRKRVYPADVTLRAFLSQVVGRDRSCQEAVTRVYLESLANSKGGPRRSIRLRTQGHAGVSMSKLW